MAAGCYRCGELVPYNEQQWIGGQVMCYRCYLLWRLAKEKKDGRV